MITEYAGQLYDEAVASHEAALKSRIALRAFYDSDLCGSLKLHADRILGDREKLPPQRGGVEWANYDRHPVTVQWTALRAALEQDADAT